ncbi:unnamed protein product [Durusdinium trenchii]|uniref:Uncharacterized protein n=1 Tax=Durusdinium trenchii TaxID=1381693 RepID=A0ABP0LJL1_9DINO
MMALQVKKNDSKAGTLPRPTRARRGMQAVPPCIFAAQRYHAGYHASCQRPCRDVPKVEKGRSFGISLALKELEYPNTHVTFAPRCDVAPAQGTGRHAIMAQAFSAATAEEIRALGEIWQLRSGQKCLEEAVARALKHICRRAERTCVLKSLRQPVARAVDLQEAAQLSDEDRLKKLDALEANAQHLASEPNTLKELLHQLAEEAPAISCDMDADSGLQPALERLGLVSSWLQRTLQQLQEAREELAEKEKAAASCAFLHLPGEAPNGQSALARLP